MTLVRWFLLFAVWPTLVAVLHAEDPKSVLVFPGANKRETYFTIHNLRAAQGLSTGRGIKVGILDHSFGTTLHPKLYAEGRNFVKGDEASLSEHEWHGYWMAAVLREIAPEAEIYALNIIVFDDPAATMDAMSRAIDWAVERRIDVLTYSQEAVKGEPRTVLDRALDRAHKAGIVTTFIHCSEPGNILPSGLWSGTDDGREPDVNVLHYDYSVVFIDEYRKAVAGEKTWYQPFLSVSSTSPVVGGVVALMKGLKPDLTPAQCKAILRETARPLEFEGETAPRTLDAGAAVSRVKALR
ncbi:MAG: peptidase [Acidobacteria bacterium]|nr:peptidase [Acidobacteriota bacterium]